MSLQKGPNMEESTLVLERKKSKLPPAAAAKLIREVKKVYPQEVFRQKIRSE